MHLYLLGFEVKCTMKCIEKNVTKTWKFLGCWSILKYTWLAFEIYFLVFEVKWKNLEVWMQYSCKLISQHVSGLTTITPLTICSGDLIKMYGLTRCPCVIPKWQTWNKHWREFSLASQIYNCFFSSSPFSLFNYVNEMLCYVNTQDRERKKREGRGELAGAQIQF